MLRIGFTGVPGAGKTSTARALVSNLRYVNNHKNIELVQEYARRYISKHGNIEHIWEQYRITSKQIEWEENITNENLDILVTDSPIFLSFLYAIELKKTNEKDIMVFNDIFKMLTKLNFPKPRYDIIFHLPPTIEPVDDGIRSKIQFQKEWRENSEQQIKSILNIFQPGIMITLHENNLNDRVDKCIEILNNWG